MADLRSMRPESRQTDRHHRCGRRRRRSARLSRRRTATTCASTIRRRASTPSSALDDAEIVFVCVPTPYAPGRGFDDSLPAATRSALCADRRRVVIKSTVLPGTTAAAAGAHAAAPLHVQPGVPARSDGVRRLHQPGPPDRRAARRRAGDCAAASWTHAAARAVRADLRRRARRRWRSTSPTRSSPSR